MNEPGAGSGNASARCLVAAERAVTAQERIRLLVSFFHSGSPASASSQAGISTENLSVGAPVTRPVVRLDAVRMGSVLKLLNRHPGAPMAMLDLCRIEHPLRRVQELLIYIGKQSQEITLDSASDQGSVTPYVSPARLHEVMQVINKTHGGERLDLPELRERARNQVLGELFQLASATSTLLREEVRGDWAKDEMSERRRIFGDPTAAGTGAGAPAPVALPPSGNPVRAPAPEALAAPVAPVAPPPAAPRVTGFGFGFGLRGAT